eukprot:1191957-Prorocentrum_minimum.AAC.2
MTRSAPADGRIAAAADHQIGPERASHRGGAGETHLRTRLSVLMFSKYDLERGAAAPRETSWSVWMLWASVWTLRASAWTLERGAATPRETSWSVRTI